MATVTIIDTLFHQQMVYNRLCDGDRHKALLYSVQDASFDEFKALLDDGWAIEISYNDKPVTMAWVDTFLGTTAFVHFATYLGTEEFMLQSVRDGIDWFFEIGKHTALFGLTPKSYRPIFRRILWPGGFEKILEEPSMCYIARYDKFVPGVITRLGRENWERMRDNIWREE